MGFRSFSFLYGCVLYFAFYLHVSSSLDGSLGVSSRLLMMDGWALCCGDGNALRSYYLGLFGVPFCLVMVMVGVACLPACARACFVMLSTFYSRFGCGVLACLWVEDVLACLWLRRCACCGVDERRRVAVAGEAKGF